MAPKLYGDTRSSCVRAVLLTAKALNIDVEYVMVDVVKKENLSEEFLKLNPRHSVPTLEDNGFVLWDSHAIMMYLSEKYGNDNPVYPKDIQKRSIINQMLHFETADIFAMHRFIVDDILHQGEPKLRKDAVRSLEGGYKFIETFLKDSKFITGSDLTLADFSIWTTLSNSEILVPIDEKKYPGIISWMDKMESLPYSNLNKEGALEFVKFLEVVKQK